MRTDEIKNEISKLAMSEKLLLIEDVWDQIAESNAELSLPDWQKQELNSRLSQYKSGQLKTKNWLDAHEELRNKYE